MLHHRPAAPEPDGTRPSTPGSGFDPGPQAASGVGNRGGSARRTVGALAGVWPVPCPIAARSLTPFPPPMMGSGGSVIAPAADRPPRIASTSETTLTTAMTRVFHLDEDMRA